MELTKNVAERIVQVDKSHIRFKHVFSGFVEGARYLIGPHSPITGLKLEASVQGDFLDVWFAGMRIRFLLLVCYGEDGLPRGKVVCLREIPNLSDANDILGSFTFSRQGTTDIDFEEGHDHVVMEYHAIEIVLHFVNLAIGEPLPMPSMAG